MDDADLHTTEQGLTRGNREGRMKEGTRPMKIKCSRCDTRAHRLLISLDTGEDLPMCIFHLGVYATPWGGRPLPEVSDRADHLVTEYRKAEEASRE